MNIRGSRLYKLEDSVVSQFTIYGIDQLADIFKSKQNVNQNALVLKYKKIIWVFIHKPRCSTAVWNFTR
jgi:type VI protein secretion system component Hcp